MPISKKNYGNWLERLQAVIRYRSFLLKSAGIGLLAGLIIALSLPKEYECSIFTAPESTGISLTDETYGLSIDAALGKDRIQDALLPSLYPQLIASPTFLIPLFEVPVQPSFCLPDSTISLYEYMDRHQRRPWWNFLQSAFSKAVGLLTGSFLEKPRRVETNYTGEQTEACPGILSLSAKDSGIAGAIRSRLTIGVDREKRTITITCRMQDPHVATAVADTVRSRIQALITDYRTQKERKNLAHVQKWHCQARERYYQAQETQAAFEDSHRDLSTRMARKELVNLQIKTAQAREEYERTARLVQAAEVRVVKVRPVFAVIQPATTPVDPVSPSLLKYMVVFALLGFLVGCAGIWVRGRRGRSASHG